MLKAGVKGSVLRTREGFFVESGAAAFVVLRVGPRHSLKMAAIVAVGVDCLTLIRFPCLTEFQTFRVAWK